MEFEHLPEIKYELDLYEDKPETVDIADLFNNGTEENLPFEVIGANAAAVAGGTEKGKQMSSFLVQL
ncbi:unnamed protein product [Diabrotica balteata]|uniref:Uncharacterized protein n=1 Tax=Diabrotica balteata TaxID=107213 RepID=A0A9N9XE85_DIABA|nr:unnamed protein product [Diabrotica balteata]